MSYGPLLTRSYGPNPKGSKLTINEMDNNLLYLEELATLRTGGNYAQTVGEQVTLNDETGTIVSVEITTNGSPVQITVTGDANPIGASGSWVQLQLFRDGGSIGNVIQAESSDINENVPYALNYIDEPSAGTYTYTLRAVDIAGEFEFGESDGPVITAVELVNRNWEQTVGTQVTVVEGDTDTLISVSVTTTGAPVQIMVTGDANPTTDDGGFVRLQLYRDGHEIGNVVQAESSKTNENIPYALNFIDEVGSGNYTYELRVIDVAGSDFIFGESDGPVMTVVELTTGSGWNENSNTVIDSTRSNSRGGEYNSICCSDDATIIGGRGNCTYGSDESSIIGGHFNEIYGSSKSIILGGNGTPYGGCLSTYICNSQRSAILAGHFNKLYDADRSVSVGGSTNNICDGSNNSGIFTGFHNCVREYSCDSSIISGCRNTINNNSCQSSIISGYCNLIYDNSCQSVIVGGYSNCLVSDSEGSVILGGCQNCISCCSNYSIISGRGNEIFYSCNSAIIGGRSNRIEGCYDYCSVNHNSIIGGCENCITYSDYASIIGGGENCIVNYGDYSSILGGCLNTIDYQTQYSTIVGGVRNTLCNSYFSAILGGCQNRICNSGYRSYFLDISEGFSTIVGGYSNFIYDDSFKSTMIGGLYNCIHGSVRNSSIIGGHQNEVCCSSADSSILGGCNNNLFCCTEASSIIGGCNNDMCGGFVSYYFGAPYNVCYSSQGRIFTSTIVGGDDNSICDQVCNSTILGGCNNTIKGSIYITPGGSYAYESSNSAIVGGRYNHIDTAIGSTIIGSCGDYYSTRIYRSAYSSIISNSSCYGSYIRYSCGSSILASYESVISNSDNSTILGGFCHRSCESSYSSIIGGGENCIRRSDYSSIIGGCYNQICCCSDTSAIIGGCNNSVNCYSYRSAIIGGCCNNMCNSDNSIIIGGNHLTLDNKNNTALFCCIGTNYDGTNYFGVCCSNVNLGGTVLQFRNGILIGISY